MNPPPASNDAAQLRMRLYEFQSRILETARRKIAGGSRRLILCAPTGAGKTAISSAIIAGARAKGKKCMFICHRAELREQAKRTLADCGVKTGTIAANAFSALHLPVQVAQIGTACARRKERWKDWAEVIIVDECHHMAARSWRETIAYLGENAVVVGLTATPQRLDGKGLDEDFDEIVRGPDIRELIDSGHLSDFDTFTTREKYDLALVHVAMGDFSQRDLEKQIGKKRVRNVVEAYERHGKGGKALFFGVSVRHSREVEEWFIQKGIKARHLDGKTPPKERKWIIQAFETGDLQVLCNCGIVSEGFDCPSASVLIDDAPTMSLTNYLQRAGRVLRSQEGKRAVILDLAGNYMRHGLADSPREWLLQGRPRKRKKGEKELARTRECLKCYAVNHISSVKCQVCGAELAQPAAEVVFADTAGLKKVEEVPGREIVIGDDTIKIAALQNPQKSILSVAHRKAVLGTLTLSWLKEAAKAAGYAEGWAKHQLTRLQRVHRRRG